MSFNQQCIYEILGFVGNRDGPRSYWCRRWSLSLSALYVVSEDEAGGAILAGQILQWEDLVTPLGFGLQAILSRDAASLRSVDGITSCVISRKLRDYGLRRCSLPAATPRLGLEDVSELSPFLEAVRRLAAQGAYALCTDGSSDTVRRPSEQFFREPGRYVAGAGIVAVPAPGLPLGTLLPSLFIPDLHAATDCAFPLEYIAAVIARFTAAVVPGCKDIFVDCKSVIDLLGQLPREASYAGLDKIWPVNASRSLLKPRHVHSHQDDSVRFDRLSRAAQGNCLADAVAENKSHYLNLQLPVVTVSFERLLDCCSTAECEWRRYLQLPDGSSLFHHSVCEQVKLSRQLIAPVYWQRRDAKSLSGYSWSAGHTRLAAAAGLGGKRGKAGASGTVKLTHDKYWWGNRYNPQRAPCKGCEWSMLFPYKTGHPLAALVLDADKDKLIVGEGNWGSLVPPHLLLEGIEHWGSVCVDFKVAKIRRESEKAAWNLLSSHLGSADRRDAFRCASTVLTFMLVDPLRFQGRLGTVATLLTTSVLNERSSWPSSLYVALTACVRLFMEAGKDIYSLQSPGQELARQQFKTAQAATKAAHAVTDAKNAKTKADGRKKRIREAEATRLAQEGQGTLHEFLLPPPSTPTVGRREQEELVGRSLPSLAPVASVALPTLEPVRSCASFLMELEATEELCSDELVHPLSPDSITSFPVDLKQGVSTFLQRRRALFTFSSGLESAIRAADLSKLAPRKREEWEALVREFVLMVGRACEPRSQTSWYAEAVCSYSSARVHRTITQSYTRDQLADLLLYALNRYARNQISELGTFNITVNLDDPIDDTGYKRGSLGNRGVRWSDVLFCLGLDHLSWTTISGHVIEHFKEVFQGTIPLDSPPPTGMAPSHGSLRLGPSPDQMTEGVAGAHHCC